MKWYGRKKLIWYLQCLNTAYNGAEHQTKAYVFERKTDRNGNGNGDQGGYINFSFSVRMVGKLP
jgi:hypothetical protein